MRADGRRADELRAMRFEVGWKSQGEGSCLVRSGNTAVLCVAGGFGSDTFRRYLAGNVDEPAAPKPARATDDAPTKPLPPEPELEPEARLRRCQFNKRPDLKTQLFQFS